MKTTTTTKVYNEMVDQIIKKIGSGIASDNMMEIFSLVVVVFFVVVIINDNCFVIYDFSFFCIIIIYQSYQSIKTKNLMTVIIAMKI